MSATNTNIRGRSARWAVRFAARFLAREIYRGILGREPDEAELSACVGAIKGTGDISPSLSRLISSKAGEKVLAAQAPRLVTVAYEALLEREPDPQGLKSHSDRLKKDNDLASFLRRMIDSREFKARHTKPALFSEFLTPLWSRRIRNPSIEATPEQFEQLFERIQSEWTQLGDTEPHWSVITSNKFKADRFAENEDAFYKSGEGTFGIVKLFAERAGISIDPAATVLELGCGTGRVTHVLAREFARVVAADISPGNLRLCAQKTRSLGQTNVEHVLLKSPRDIEKIGPIDFFFSTIVLQHNPPPVSYYFLDQILGKVRKSGAVLFQVPTHYAGYSFDIVSYLKSPQVGMEMHALPMNAVFSLFAKHGLRPVEVLMDSWTAWPGSHTFFAVKE